MTTRVSHPDPTMATDTPVAVRSKEAERIRKLANVLDSQFTLPFGMRIGVDGLIGLIPGIGDLVGGGLSLWLIMRAKQLGVRKRVIAKMIVHAGVDTVLGSIPFLGDLFDFGYKANTKNAKLLLKELDARDNSQEPINN